MQAKIGHGEEEKGGVGDYSNALLRPGHQPLHELQTPCLDLLLLFPEVWAPQLILFCLNLQVATLLWQQRHSQAVLHMALTAERCTNRSCSSRVTSQCAPAT